MLKNFTAKNNLSSILKYFLLLFRKSVNYSETRSNDMFKFMLHMHYSSDLHTSMIAPNKKTSIIQFAARYAALVNLYV